METKVCTKCGIEKPLDQFVKNSNKPDGLSPQCKECKHKYYEEYYKKHKYEIYKKHRSRRDFLAQYMRQLKSNGCIIVEKKIQLVQIFIIFMISLLIQEINVETEVLIL